MRLRSLQLRLAVRLALVYVAAIAMAVSFFVYQAYNAAADLSDRLLGLRAADLARYVSLDISGTPRLDLPPEMGAAYAATSDSDAFVIRTSNGRIIAASPASFAEQVPEWPAATENPSYFRLKNLGNLVRDYYGLSIVLTSAAGRFRSRSRMNRRSTLLFIRYFAGLCFTSVGSSRFSWRHVGDRDTRDP